MNTMFKFMIVVLFFAATTVAPHVAGVNAADTHTADDESVVFQTQDIPFYYRTNLGTNKFMTSQGVLRANGRLDVWTNTMTGTWFGGYSGCVQLTFYDAYNIAIGHSTMHRFGVDGTVIGLSDRTDMWVEQISPDLRARIESVTIAHWRCPTWKAAGLLVDIVTEAIKIGMSLFDVTGDLHDSGAFVSEPFSR